MRHQDFMPPTLKNLSIVLLVFLFITGFLACNNDKKEDEKTNSTSLSPTPGFQVNCVKLSRAQIQSWVDSGWTKPGSSQIKELVFQFFTANTNSINSNMQLVVYPGQSSTDVKLNGKQELQIDTSCAGKTISAPLIFANISLNADSLKIFKSDGTLNDFDYIRLIPAQDYPLYINFKIEIVTKGETQTLQGRGVVPCPPYCCPPYCE